MNKSYAYRALETTALINGVSTQEVIDAISAAIAAVYSKNTPCHSNISGLTPPQLVEYIADRVVADISD